MSESNKLLSVNKYTISVSFVNSNLIISDIPNTNSEIISQRFLKFNEICNYFNSRFPARILTVSMNFDEIDKLFASRVNVEDDKLMDIDIMVTPVGSDAGVSHLMPFSQGRYRALLKTNETVNSYLTTRDTKTLNEQNIDMSTTLEFILFKDAELSFSLNTNINFLYNGNNLMTVLAHMIHKAIPETKLVISKLDHNPNIGKFLIPRMSLQDGIDLLNDEFGLFRSGYNLFVENDTMYFLNKEEDPRVTVDSLDYEILLDVNRFTGQENASKYKQTIENDRSMVTKINVDKIKIYVNNSGVLKNDPVYISPSGKTSFQKGSSARNVDYVRKITEIPHLQSYNNLQYEFIELNLDDVSFINVNNLTKIIYIDSTNNIRVYRVNFKSTTVISNENTITKLQAFRILNKS